MKKNTHLFLYLFILISISLMTHFQPVLCKPLGSFLNTFEICKNPIIISKDNLRKIIASKDFDKGKIIRLCALVDPISFSEKQLQNLGWKVINRLGEIVTLQGNEQTASYLSSVSGICYVKTPLQIPLVSACMDSVRKMTKVDLVNGTLPSNLGTSFSGKNVLVGMVETEFDTHHPAFLDAQGKTRFIAIWDQEDTVKNHNGLSYGRIEWGQELNSDSMFAINGEFHGTLMTSYAAGSDKTYPYYGVAPEATIIGVKYTDANTEADVINGLTWIFHVADSLKVPCVANLSIGMGPGPHDGTSLVDRTIDKLSTPGHVVVGAIGNDGVNQTHISFSLSGNQAKGTFIEATVVSQTNPPRALAYSGADLWGDSGKVFSATYYILDKRNSTYAVSGNQVVTTGSRIYKPDIVQWNDTIEKKKDTLIFYTTVAQSDSLNHRPHLEVTSISTDSNLVMGMSVAYLSNASGTIHAWNIEKIPFFSNGINNFFDGDSAYTLNEIGGTAKKIISVGGYISRATILKWDGTVRDNGEMDNIGKIWPNSGNGPTLDGRMKPEITAPAKWIVGAINRLRPDGGYVVIWPDTHSTNGRYYPATGTSASSPIVAGIVALMLQAKPTLTSDEVKQILQSTAIKDPFTGPLNSNQWGAGKVNAYGALANVLGVTKLEKPFTDHGISGNSLIVSGRQQRVLIIKLKNAGPDKMQVVFYGCSGKKVSCFEIGHTNTVILPTTIPEGVYVAKVLCNGKTIFTQKLALW